MHDGNPSIAAIEALHRDLESLKRIPVDIDYIKKDIAEIKDSIAGFRDEYVTQREFDSYKWTLRAVVTGLIANSIALLYK